MTDSDGRRTPTNEHAALKASAEAAIEAFAAQCDPFEIRHTVQVTSFGGSGTTALCGSFMAGGVDLQPGPAHWPFKHIRTPPAAHDVPPGFRVVYPLSDPRDAVLSIFRRNYQVGHWRTLCLGDPVVVPPSLDSIEQYVAARVDEFHLADHVRGWMGHPPGYPVMFVRFDHIDDVWDEVASFVGLPPDHPPVRRRPRSSDWRETPPAIRDGIQEIYGDLADLIDALPPVHVVS